MAGSHQSVQEAASLILRALANVTMGTPQADDHKIISTGQSARRQDQVSHPYPITSESSRDSAALYDSSTGTPVLYGNR